MGIDTLLFDLDDTLIKEVELARRSFEAAAAVVNRLHAIPTTEFIPTVRTKARELWHSFDTVEYTEKVGISSWEALWANFSELNPFQKKLKGYKAQYQFQPWFDALMAFGIEDRDLAQRLSMIYKRTRRNLHEVFEDTFPVLHSIRDRYTLGLITNGSDDLQNEKIDASGLRSFFKSIIIAGEVGIGKPHRDIFEIALKSLGSTSDSTLMIGNSLESDILGAQTLGIHTIWLNRDRIGNDSEIFPDFECSTLHEILHILI